MTMKKSALIVGGAVCLAMVLVAIGMADPAHPARESELLQSCLRYERVLTTTADFPPSQRTLLAVTLAAAELQSTDASEFLAAYRQAGTLLSYHPISDTSYFWNGSEWENSYRTTYTYGAGSRLADAIGQAWSAAQWNNSAKQLYTYDGNGRLNTYASQTWQTSAWVNYGLSIYSYDGSGNMVEILSQRRQDNAWVNFYRTTLTYSGVRVTTSTSESWQAGSWVNSSRTTYTYDVGGHLTEMLFQNWQGGGWVNQGKTTSTYDLDGRETQSLSQAWAGTDWVNSFKSDYSYDGSGNEILDVQSAWMVSFWMATDADTSKYSGGYLVETVEYAIQSNTLYRAQYTYDGSGNRIEELYQASPAGGSWTNEEREVHVYESFVDVAVSPEQMPRAFDLAQNYPNPFNPSTVISYSLGRDCHVKVVVSNILGQMVTTLVDADQAVGPHSVVWNGLDDRGMQVVSGIYLFRVQAGDFAQIRKMVLLK
jgi:hypothetical protein